MANGNEDFSQFSDVVTSLAEIREVLREPMVSVVAKQIDRIDDVCKAIIEKSPIVVIASAYSRRYPEISPKGDPHGCVRILDEKRLAIPERPGNRREDNMKSYFSGHATHAAMRLIQVLLFLIVLGSARAQSQTNTDSETQLTILGGVGFGGNFTTDNDLQIDLDDGSDLGFILDFEYDEETQWEFLYLQNSTSADTSDLSGLGTSIDTDIRYFQGGGTYRGSGERVRPYLAGTAGLTRVEPHGENTDSDTFWSGSIGGGVLISVSEHISFRLEGRVFATFVNANSSIYCGSNLDGGQCLFLLESDVVWQSHAFAGITFRF